MSATPRSIRTFGTRATSPNFWAMKVFDESRCRPRTRADARHPEAGHLAGRPHRHGLGREPAGSPARRPGWKGHRLRAAHDALLVGVETVLARRPRTDRPFAGPAAWTSRFGWCWTAGCRTPATARICKRRPNSLILTLAVAGPSGRRRRGRRAGSRHRTDAPPSAAACLLKALKAVGASPSVLIEGGGQVAASLSARGGWWIVWNGSGRRSCWAARGGRA